MSIDPVAAAGFAATAEAYERGRPGYPRELVGQVAAALGLDGTTTVVDVAAGTGKLTRELPGRVIAVEPLLEMRAVLGRTAPDAAIHQGTAEALPLPDASADAIVCAEAFHWFDQPRALDEFRRVLRPGGGIALLHNATDREGEPWMVDWMARHGRLRTEASRSGSRADWGDVLGPTGRAEVAWEQQLDHDAYVDLVGSWSWIGALPHDERATALDELRAALPDGPIRLPWRAQAMWRRPA